MGPTRSRVPAASRQTSRMSEISRSPLISTDPLREYISIACSRVLAHCGPDCHRVAPVLIAPSRHLDQNNLWCWLVEFQESPYPLSAAEPWAGRHSDGSVPALDEP